METFQKKIDELKPYKRNTKKHDQTQIDNVAESIRKFGFVQPIVVDKNGVIVIGHCRYFAAKQLGMEEVPCVSVEYLTPEQVNALRIIDNKTNESPWDMELLGSELEGLDLDGFQLDFDFESDSFLTDGAEAEQEEYERKKAEFQERMQSGELSEDDEEYQEFLKKFEPKRTTDDCYTPELVYEAVADWCASECGLKKADFVRPFYPGGDYQNYDYKKTDIVVDNPPFSIMAEIIGFYLKKGIKFFLFAPSVTTFSSSSSPALCGICVGASVIYENGACVNTSFLTNLESGIRFRSAPSLYKAVTEANKKNLESNKKELPKYSYPDEVVTSSMVAKYSKYGIEFSVSVEESARIGELDEQKKTGKSIYGSGYLLSEKAAAEKAAAEKWTLSDREKKIVKSLGGAN